MSCAPAAASTLPLDLNLTTVSYGQLRDKDPDALGRLSSALMRNGAVAISEVPDFPEQRQAFFEEAIAFSILPDAEKAKVASGGVDTTYSYLGYDNDF